MLSPSNSRKAASYVMAIRILDEIFAVEDVFGLKGTSLYSIKDCVLLLKIRDFVKSEERKMRMGEDSIFRHGNPGQTSYPRSRFCSAAMSSLIDYFEYERTILSADSIVEKEHDAELISKELLRHFDLTKEGKDALSEQKRRIGQNYFRQMILVNYGLKCCVTGLNVPVILRASHIVEWSKDKKNRLNPENGLCLSATYDAAFDKHLISFDEDYRMILSSVLKEFYTSDVTKEYFQAYEGKKITMPCRFLPSQDFLQIHRSELAV